jgi:hypothetical protein
MTIRLNPRWLLVPILFLTLQLCHAQSIVLPSTLSFDLGGDTNAPESQLWDLNGSYSVELLVERNGQAVPVEVAFTLIQKPNGSLTTTTNELVNAAVTFNNDTDSSFACLATISGKVTGSAGVARAHFTVRFVGNGALGGRSTTINGGLTVDAFADATTGGQLVGGQSVGSKPCSFHATFPGLNTITGTSDFAVDLPPGVDGSWNLTLHLVGLGRVSGTGIIATPHDSLGLHLTGKFKSGLFITKAVGANDVADTVSGVGASATILVPQTFDTVQVDGKFLGQKMSFNVSVPPPQ